MFPNAIGAKYVLLDKNHFSSEECKKPPFIFSLRNCSLQIKQKSKSPVTFTPDGFKVKRRESVSSRSRSICQRGSSLWLTLGCLYMLGKSAKAGECTLHCDRSINERRWCTRRSHPGVIKGLRPQDANFGCEGCARDTDHRLSERFIALQSANISSALTLCFDPCVKLKYIDRQG